MATITEGEVQNNEFFIGKFGDLWKQMVPPAVTQIEIDFIIEACGLKPGDRVLDLMCGYGRHSLELGKRGIQTFSIDYVSAYIDEINQIATAEGFPVKAVQGSVLDVEPEGMFDAVIWMGNSFAFFTRPNNEAVLRMAARHLKPGGKMIIDTWMIAEVALPHFKNKSWNQYGDVKYIMSYEYHLNPARIESEQTLLDESGPYVKHAVDYIFTLDETRTMLAQAGLSMDHLYTNPRKRKWRLGDPTLYIVTTREA